MKPNSNIDPTELEKFSRLADTWWDRNGPLRSLHHINPLRVGYIAGHVALQESRVLDVGCGGGILSEEMAGRGAEVTGIDASAEAIGAARVHLATGDGLVSYEQATAERFAARRPAQFDAVVCMELLEHVPEPASVVVACGRLARPGGWVFFATLNRTVKSYLFAILGAEVILRLLPSGTHRWQRFVRPSELDGWAATAGLRLVDRTGLHYNPFTRRYFLGKNTDVNYMAAYRKAPALKRLRLWAASSL